MDQTRILAWNCRGLGDTSAISELKKLCFQHKPSIIFLSETKRTTMEMTSIRPDLGFDQCFAVDCVGRGGGLAMLWRDDFSLTISTFSQSHLDVEIVDPGEGKWRLTGFYGRPEAARRKESWTLLKSLKAASSQPWLCLEALNFCDFKEMGFKGPQFTFIRKMHDTIIKERLDRVLMNPGWSGMFPGAFSHHLLALKSDHAPILVIATKTMNGFQHKRTKLFRFENYWIKDPDCEGKIKDGWKTVERDTNMSRVLSKIASCGSLLMDWSQHKFGNIPERIKLLQNELLSARNGSAHDNSLGRMEALEQELNDWQRREEVLWKQRSRVQWGSLVTDKTGVEGLCIKYFRDLFTSKYTGPNSSILSALQGRVSPLMANNLDRDFTSSEVLVALKQIHSSKAPGPDGMNANFYKNYWHIIGGDIISIALNFLNNGLWLKSILPHIISNNQSAFVPGRLIYDNIMVAFEAIHHLKNKKVGRRGHMAVKLDLSKAFDRVELNFLEDTMRAMGFPERWINRVMTCVRTVEYSVLINGCPTKKFTPSRGIRQGDPLSPFLFLLCAEGLSALLSRAIRRGDLKGLTWCRGYPCLSHLFFANDSLLFGEASVQEATRLLEILKEYEGVSGQQINLDKAKYFPNGDLLGASVGAKASMVWRGVVDGLGILKLGSTWRIGTGQDIRLWRDNWLPSGAIPRPQSALIQQDMDDRVSAFIDVNTGCWKEGDVRQQFCAEDAESILHIPLSRSCSVDRLIWLGTNNGKFSVKSAYKYAWELIFGTQHHAHDQILKPVWRSVCFARRALNEIAHRIAHMHSPLPPWEGVWVGTLPSAIGTDLVS
ncbi:hypothetical protein SLEP1_g32779 [Rubroshorea leprosula]|uniref:Reverse transcriptase domain-containing protein n=1 Tax=Rubroshorea leprosula TaxID=152421 RepID=A0AAV5KEL1_9ROSI|nr:hypothetical protein SLEP1_g32779 [Rubroshorea leprosula]